MAGVPDELDRLWTPHRMAYVTGEDRPAAGYDAPSGCPFCRAPRRARAEGLVVARGNTVFALLNRYPYNPGHLMICPVRHVADYTDLDDAETIELARFVQDAMRVLRSVSGPHGFNLGMNQGHVAGAGIAAHLHMHVVPRWGGDTNFMPIIGRTKVLPQLLSDTRDVLAKAWEGVGEPATPKRATGEQTAGERTSAGRATGRPARGQPATRKPAAGKPREPKPVTPPG